MRIRFKDEEPQEEVVDVRLSIEIGDRGAAHLVARAVVHASYEGKWYLLTFNTDGTITRPAGIPQSLGLKLDHAGRINVE